MSAKYFLIIGLCDNIYFCLCAKPHIQKSMHAIKTSKQFIDINITYIDMIYATSYFLSHFRQYFFLTLPTLDRENWRHLLWITG